MMAYEHEHKYFLFQIKKDFEPIVVDGAILYKLFEYGYSGCNCGNTVKAEVIQKVQNEKD